MKYYAWVQLETGEFGIETDWVVCKSKVHGVSSKYKSFFSEADAENWLGSLEEQKEIKEHKVLVLNKVEPNVVYFDSGTGGGQGTEVRITDDQKEPLLKLVVAEDNLTKKGNLNLGDRTNNFGEALGMYFAIQIATKLGLKKIAGDSNLVIEYWSRGNFNKKLPEETQRLLGDLIVARSEFESNGGKVYWISGALNPSDLGFHISKK